jgi:hypothetical protein
MAEYKGIKGFKVQYLSADPSDPNIGQTWYNSTSKDLKYTGATAAGAWATGNSMGTARSIRKCRNSNSSFSFWWCTPVLQQQPKNITEQLGLLSNSLNTARDALAGAGTQTAALAFGGYATALYRSN